MIKLRPILSNVILCLVQCNKRMMQSICNTGFQEHQKWQPRHMSTFNLRITENSFNERKHSNTMIPIILRVILSPLSFFCKMICILIIKLYHLFAKNKRRVKIGVKKRNQRKRLKKKEGIHCLYQPSIPKSIIKYTRQRSKCMSLSLCLPNSSVNLTCCSISF